LANAIVEGPGFEGETSDGAASVLIFGGAASWVEGASSEIEPVASGSFARLSEAALADETALGSISV
jgi:hypothetical protein